MTRARNRERLPADATGVAVSHPQVISLFLASCAQHAARGASEAFRTSPEVRHAIRLKVRA